MAQTMLIMSSFPSSYSIDLKRNYFHNLQNQILRPKLFSHLFLNPLLPPTNSFSSSSLSFTTLALFKTKMKDPPNKSKAKAKVERGIFGSFGEFDCKKLKELFVGRVAILAFAPGQPKKSKGDRLLMWWWAFTGLTHIIVEGYFVFSPQFLEDKTGFFLAEVWKEYSKADSRYAERDGMVIAIEGLTSVLEGPASLLALYAIASEKSYSYILQFAISLGQLYGVAVYYITAILEGDHFSATSFCAYAYFIGAFSIWTFIPSIVAIRCWRKICVAFQLQRDNTEK